MYSDHDIHSLVEILGHIRLGGENSLSLAFHNAPLIHVDDEDDSVADVRLFACCSNPYGAMPIILWVLGLVASSVSADTGLKCDFVRVSHSAWNGTISLTYGLFMFELLDCDTKTGPCQNVAEIINATECVPYPPKWNPGQYVQASRVFHTLAGIFGWLAMFMLLISMCFIFKQRTWWIVTALLLVVTFFQGLVFLAHQPVKEYCSEPDVTCSIGTDTTEVIIACCLWFLVAIGTGYLAKVGKKHELMSEVVDVDEGDTMGK